MSAVRHAVVASLAAVLGCGGESPAPAPSPAPPPPPAPAPPAACVADLVPALPTREVKSPLAVPDRPALAEARRVLREVVEQHGRDPLNPWAVAHAMLALGPEVALTNNEPAVDWLFREYAEITPDGKGLAFPPRRGPIRIEPHTDLLLKAFAEGGVDPAREVMVDGRKFHVEDLLRTSLCATWVDGSHVWAASWNDTPWTLQALAQWAPPGFSWTATGGHAMSMDGFTSAVVGDLRTQTAFLRDARASGEPVAKQRQGIFAYTCGGAHLIQGPVWAVGRGFGTEQDKAALAEELSLHLWRMDLELKAVDENLPKYPDYADDLLDQRIKFLGHLLETVHKAAALGVFVPTADERARLDLAATELAATVAEVQRRGTLAGLPALRTRKEQLYLDYVGDAAHALRGLDLHTGAGTVRY